MGESEYIVSSHHHENRLGVGLYKDSIFQLDGQKNATKIVSILIVARHLESLPMTSLVHRLSPRVNEKRTSSDGKLGGAWEQG